MGGPTGVCHTGLGDELFRHVKETDICALGGLHVSSVGGCLFWGRRGMFLNQLSQLVDFADFLEEDCGRLRGVSINSDT